MQAHSWIEAHPIQKLIQAHSKSDFDTIQAQLEYKPTQEVILKQYKPSSDTTPPFQTFIN